MGEDTLRLQSRQVQAAQMPATPVLKWSPPHRKPSRDIPVSTLMWTFSVPPQRTASALYLQCLGSAGHRLRDVVAQQLLHPLRRRMAQNQNGHMDTPGPQLHGLVQTGHRQIVRPQLFQLPGHLHRTVAVASAFTTPRYFTPGPIFCRATL